MIGIRHPSSRLDAFLPKPFLHRYHADGAGGGSQDLALVGNEKKDGNIFRKKGYLNDTENENYNMGK